MIDLTPVETLLRNTESFEYVEGVLSVRNAINNGISGQNAAFVMPMGDVPTPTSRGNFYEDQVRFKFAVVIGLSTGGGSDGGDNAQLAELIATCIDTTIAQLVDGASNPIELGPGGLLPINNSGCVFWQQEFSVIHYVEK